MSRPTSVAADPDRGQQADAASPSAPAFDPIATFCAFAFGDRPGAVCTAYGHDPYRTESGKYEHREWHERRYIWPDQRDQLIADARRETSTGMPVDIYVNPALRLAGTKGRRQGDAVPPSVCWVDLDQEPTDPALFAQLLSLGALVVRSGSDGHRHPYFPLTRAVDLGTHQRLNKALADRLGGDAKWPDNSLLRMPGTRNWKSTAPPVGVEPGPVEATRKDAVKAIDDPSSAKQKAYLTAVEALDEIEISPLPRLLADDATPEAVVSLLAEYGSIGVISAEPGLFGILAGRYSSGAPNIEWFLKATSGEAINVDRMGREPQDVPNPALSLACCIQPGRLVELGQVKAFRDSGLLARLLYVVPRSAVGERRRTTRIRTEHADKWSKHLTYLAQAGREHREKPATLALDEDGRDVLDEFRAEIEPHLHPEYGRYAGIADWMNKLPGATVRIAAALTLIHEPRATEITAATMRNAVRVGKSYISHAIAAFGMTRPNAEVFSQARQVLATVLRLCNDEGAAAISRRAVHQKLRDRTWVENAASLSTPIELLCDYGHLRRHEVKAGPAGGRPSELLEPHPSHRAGVNR